MALKLSSQFGVIYLSTSYHPIELIKYQKKNGLENEVANILQGEILKIYLNSIYATL